ncbi:hypothetical protein WJX74_000650 [Apatococcus lobatus]|uniref:Nucleotide-diphospho-sugar transferase domain-containing protein n=1 Tax=Apatococcus lobatus TaxID=904363 RepID=A0AAW1QZK3_9CHLO
MQNPTATRDGQRTAVSLTKVQGASPSLTTTLKDAATSDPAVLLSVADQKSLVSSLPFVLSSLAACGPSLHLADHLVVVVRGFRDKDLCDSLHRRCWVDEVEEVPGNQVTQLIWRKAEVAATAINLGIGVFAVDLDLVFLQNPFKLLIEPELRKLDYFAQPEAADADYSYREAWVNTGFHYFAPTLPSQKLLQHWLKNQSAWDQTAMQSLLLSNTITGLSWQVLDSNMARSLCHLDSALSDLTSETGNFAAAVRAYFARHEPHWDRAVLFHFPCCSEPAAATCKSILASVVLEFWLQQRQTQHHHHGSSVR